MLWWTFERLPQLYDNLVSTYSGGDVDSSLELIEPFIALRETSRPPFEFNKHSSTIAPPLTTVFMEVRLLFVS